MSGPLFEKYRSAMIGQTILHVWQIHGSTLFLECGDPDLPMRRDGLTEQPLGHYSVMIEGGWRIADGASILFDRSGENDVSGIGQALTGGKIEDLRLAGNPPELSVHISGGIRVISAADGEQPGWRLFDRRSVPGAEIWIKFRDGDIREDR